MKKKKYTDKIQVLNFFEKISLVYISGKLKTEYKHDRLVFAADMNLAANPAINLNASVGHGAWAAGYATSFDTAKSAITKNHFAVGYATKEAVLHCTCNDGKVRFFSESILKKYLK